MGQATEARLREARSVVAQISHKYLGRVHVAFRFMTSTLLKVWLKLRGAYLEGLGVGGWHILAPGLEVPPALEDLAAGL